MIICNSNLQATLSIEVDNFMCMYLITQPECAGTIINNDFLTAGSPLGLVHIEVYAIRYSLYAIRFALRHRRHSSDVVWK